MTVVTVITAAICLVLAGGLWVAWRHNPTRKWLQRNLDPRWQKTSRPGDYSAEAIKAEAKQMFVSSTEMRDGCDIIWDEFDPDPPEALFEDHADGTVLWVNTMHVPRFIDEYLRRLRGRFVLVTARENNSTAEFDVDRVLAHPGLMHWFMENFEHPRSYVDDGHITPIPVGLNYHKLDPGSPNQSRDMGLPAIPAVQQLDMKAIRDTLPPSPDRPLKVYSNFHLNMDTFLRHPHAQKRANARQEAKDGLSGKPFVLWEPRQAPRHAVWKRHAEVSFEASPRGNSIDCHRTYEALILGNIPIVGSTLLDPLYDGLPVAIVEDWSDITEDRLAAWKAEFAPWFEKPLPPELYSQHWIDLFHSFKPDRKA